MIDNAKKQRWSCASIGAALGTVIVAMGVLTDFRPSPTPQERAYFQSVCKTDTCEASCGTTPECSTYKGILSVRYEESYHNAPSTSYIFQSGQLSVRSDYSKRWTVFSETSKDDSLVHKWSHHSPVEVTAVMWKGRIVAFYRDGHGSRQEVITQGHPYYAEYYFQDRKTGYIALAFILASILAVIFYGVAVNYQEKEKQNGGRVSLPESK